LRRWPTLAAAPRLNNQVRGADWRAGMSDDEILARLFALNQQRAVGQ
jgi:hypothetical protein